ncbi:hypothetical protein BD410DRAFT_796470 [Rickenella mellea]|uniref:Thioesterase domain-containing protein n=1 Tax=Rickenella mellea TaxID=50990 RepID=A0A4Y7PJF6_9AGAM|nr:hypothetical protein BD410DRAFT_796470 [Rickenella mellea]
MSTSGVFRRSHRAAENVRRAYSTFHPPRPSRRTIKPSHSVAALLAASLSFYTVGSLYPPSLLTLVSQRPAPPPPDPDLPSSQAATQALEEAQENLPILQKMRSAPDADEWYETRPYAQYPEARKANSLTGGALRGPGNMAVPPLVRARRDEKEACVFIHVGRGVCGHDGIIHGGLIATLLDEALGRNAIVNLPEKINLLTVVRSISTLQNLRQSQIFYRQSIGSASQLASRQVDQD